MLLEWEFGLVSAVSIGKLRLRLHKEELKADERGMNENMSKRLTNHSMIDICRTMI